MNAFNVAYRQMLAAIVICPRCQAMNTPHASETILIDQTGTKGECSSCSFARPIEAFLPKEKP
jgi:hypothetical protein